MAGAGRYFDYLLRDARHSQEKRSLSGCVFIVRSLWHFAFDIAKQQEKTRKDQEHNEEGKKPFLHGAICQKHWTDTEECHQKKRCEKQKIHQKMKRFSRHKDAPPVCLFFYCTEIRRENKGRTGITLRNV